MLSLPASGVAYLIPAERHSHVGQWTGMMWSGVSIFALVGPLIAAALKRRFGMDAVGYWCGATMLLTAVLFAWSMFLKRREDKRSTTSTLVGVGDGEKSGVQTPASPESKYAATNV